MNKKISCRTKNWKYIYNWSGSEELNKLSEDPKESRDLAGRKERVFEKFRTKVKRTSRAGKDFQIEKVLINQKLKVLKKPKGI